MKWRPTNWIPALWLLAGAAAGAEPPAGAQTQARPAEAGAATRLWLDRQRQGGQASAHAQPLSGPVQEQIHERYRKSFSQPIPRRFDREHVEPAGDKD